jgi:hypothetical protein
MQSIILQLRASSRPHSCKMLSKSPCPSNKPTLVKKVEEFIDCLGDQVNENRAPKYVEIGEYIKGKFKDPAAFSAALEPCTGLNRTALFVLNNSSKDAPHLAVCI